VIGEGGVHTVPMGLAEGTLGVSLTNGVRMLRDSLLGLGLFLGADHLGRFGLSTVHTTVGRTHQSTITARRTLTCHPLAGRLAGGAEGGDFLAKLGDFGEQLVHCCLGIEWRGTT
jgi:hypothetical protein